MYAGKSKIIFGNQELKWHSPIRPACVLESRKYEKAFGKMAYMFDSRWTADETQYCGSKECCENTKMYRGGNTPWKWGLGFSQRLQKTNI